MFSHGRSHFSFSLSNRSIASSCLLISFSYPFLSNLWKTYPAPANATPAILSVFYSFQGSSGTYPVFCAYFTNNAPPPTASANFIIPCVVLETPVSYRKNFLLAIDVPTAPNVIRPALYAVFITSFLFILFKNFPGWNFRTVSRCCRCCRVVGLSYVVVKNNTRLRSGGNRK